MSIAQVVSRGYGSFGTVNKVTTRGYSIGAAVIPPVVTTKAPFVGGGGKSTYRYFTPDLGGKKRKRIDAVLLQEARVIKQIEAYQDRGVDLLVLDALIERLKELQITLLRLALESAAAQTYIGLKRMEEEEEDIKFILSQLDD